MQVTVGSYIGAAVSPYDATWPSEKLQNTSRLLCHASAVPEDCLSMRLSWRRAGLAGYARLVLRLLVPPPP